MPLDARNEHYIVEPWRMAHGEGAGHYYNDRVGKNADYADGWYIRKGKDTQHNVREFLIDLQLRKNRLAANHITETSLQRSLETGYNKPTVDKMPHLDYKHKKGRYEYLYRKYR